MDVWWTETDYVADCISVYNCVFGGWCILHPKSLNRDGSEDSDNLFLELFTDLNLSYSDLILLEAIEPWTNPNQQYLKKQDQISSLYYPNA